MTLPTTFNGVTNGIASYSSRSPGFSLFAIVPAKDAAQESRTAAVSCPGVQVPATCPVCPARNSCSLLSSSGEVPTRNATAAPAAPVPNTGFPFATVALIGAGCVGLVSSGWWIRRGSWSTIRPGKTHRHKSRSSYSLTGVCDIPCQRSLERARLSDNHRNFVSFCLKTVPPETFLKRSLWS